MTSKCQSGGKPKSLARAGSITSYFFEHNYCQGEKDKQRSLRLTRHSGAAATKQDNQFCLNCGKSRPREQKAGSFTAYLFKELRCECVHPKFASQVSANNFSRTGSAERSEERRNLAKDMRARLSPESQLVITPGTIIGGAFKIESIIGEGGTGVVYLATHLALQRIFALEILTARITSEKLWLRFQSEAKILAALSHPNLVKVYDLGIHGQSVFYYSMDYLNGANLADTLAHEGPQSLSRTLEIFLALLDGLAYAHRNGIIHRDIKPANIFLCSDDRADAEVKFLILASPNLSRLTKFNSSPQWARYSAALII